MTDDREDAPDPADDSDRADDPDHPAHARDRQADDTDRQASDPDQQADDTDRQASDPDQQTDDPDQQAVDPDRQASDPAQQATDSDQPSADQSPGGDDDGDGGDGADDPRFEDVGPGVVTSDDHGATEDTLAGGEHELGGGAVLTTGDTTVIARTVVRIAVPIILLTSLSLLFQGHNLPGGGFIGGVLTATGFALLFIVYGLEFIREEVLDRTVEQMPIAGRGAGSGTRSGSGVYRWILSVGLALALASGLAPLVWDLPFLTQAVYLAHGIPLYGELELASAFAFDLGVYLVVVGGLLTIVREVGEE